MIAARHPVQRPPDARLLVVDEYGAIAHAARSSLADFLEPGDLVIANDAGTLPASLHGMHLPSQAPIEVARASPTCASVPISMTLNATFTAIAVSDALTGVAVSPRARNVAVTLRA